MAIRKDIQFGGLSNSLAETVESEGTAWAAVNCTTDEGTLKGLRRYYRLGARSGASTSDVAYGLGHARYAGNERQKLTMIGGPTGGNFTLSYDGQTTGNIDWDCSKDELFSALTALSNIGPNDVVVTGGPFPGFPLYVTFIGALANTDVALMTDDPTGLTGGTAEEVTIVEEVKGGTNEAFYAVVKHSGDSDANLYLVTSNDNFVANSTWTSLATNFNASDWFFQQYFDKMFMANTTDGLMYTYVGSTNALGTPPDAPSQAPTTSEMKSAIINMAETTTSSTSSGFSSSPTISIVGTGGVKVLFAATESGRDVTVTVTLTAAKDWKFNDKMRISWATSSQTVKISDSLLRFAVLNNDGSPITIEPDFSSPGVEYPSGSSFHSKEFHFADEQRGARDNVIKLRFSFRIEVGILNDWVTFNPLLGDSWPNDTRSLILVDVPNGPVATKDTIEYAYSYWDTSTGLESGLSPIKESPEVTTNDQFGSYVHLLAVGSTQLNTTDDRVFFYRREKKTGKWRRLPTIPDWNGYEDFGATNVTASYPEMDDHWMEHELADFPEPDSIGFPTVSAGQTADGLVAWKQSLGVISGKQMYLSGVGQPLRYAPSPDDTNNQLPDDEDPLRPVTEYVPDDRAEPIFIALGLDPLIAITDLSAYGKVGDSPSDSSVFRRLPGSRGTISRRSACKLGGGATMMSQDSLWYYSISRGFSGEDNGSLIEREETKNVRLSYRRLLSDLNELVIEASDGTFYLSVNGYNTIPLDYDADRYDILTALESIPPILRGDIEVFGDNQKFYIRLIGQYAGTDGPAITATSVDLTGGAGTVTVTNLTTGGGTAANLVEHRDEYWLFSGKSYMFQSRNEKWHEGILSDSVKAALGIRTRGLYFLTTSGELMRIQDGYYEDGGAPSGGNGPAGDVVEWEYETPWMTGPRLKVSGAEAEVVGSPTITILTKDGAAGVSSFTHTLDETPTSRLAFSTKPGYKHKIILRGVSGRDEVEKLTLLVDTLGGASGT